MLLYHSNFGWPLVDEGTDIIWKGHWQPRHVDAGYNKIFKEGNTFRKCPEPIELHSGTGEEVAFIDVAADSSGICSCGLYNEKINIAVALRFAKKQLPWLTNWQHWGKHEYVTGIEPGTNPPIGQAKAREQKTLILIEPGEKRSYDLEIEVLSEQEKIQEFLKTSNESSFN
jgi:hypothetical protein